MTKEKEIGYEVGRPMWNMLTGHQECWNAETTVVKDKIVNEQGKLAIKLSIPVVSPRFFAFAEWAAGNYIRLHGTWVHKFADQRNEENFISTEELWERYNNIFPNEG